VQGLLRWASPKMMNVYDQAGAPEKRIAHEELLRKLTQRTVKRTADDTIFVSAGKIWRPRRDLNPCYRRERNLTDCN
jgi:hypothetical protein